MIALAATLAVALVPGLRFEPNQGQADPRVVALARIPGAIVQFDRAGISLLAARRDPAGPEARHEVRLTLPGAAALRFEPEGRLAGESHYYLGPDPAAWRRGVPGHAALRARAVHPGIDLLFHGARGRLEHDFLLAPGADPQRLRLRVEGGKLVQRCDGAMRIVSAAGEWILEAPLAWQDDEQGGRHAVTVELVRRGAAELGFRLGARDRRRELVIDPVLVFSSYFGGDGDTEILGAALGPDRSIYLVGFTAVAGFPQQGGPPVPAPPAFASFVTRLDPTGQTLLYSAFLGDGVQGIATLRAVAVDSDGSAVVAGANAGLSFPVKNPIGSPPTDHVNGVVARLLPTGVDIEWATWLGGSSGDEIHAVALDAAGDVYVTGITRSADFPTASPLQGARKGLSDAFLTRIDRAGTRLVYSTYFGGESSEEGSAIVVDPGGQATIGGWSGSEDLPLVRAWQSRAAGADGFLAAFDAAGAVLRFSSYLGGSDFDFVHGLALASNQDLLVVGLTASSDFPVRGALQPFRPLSPAGFLARIDAAGPTLAWSTYWGSPTAGGRLDAVAVDVFEGIWIAGTCASADCPERDPLAAAGGSAHLARVAPDGSSIGFATRIGGAGSTSDAAVALALDTRGDALVVGATQALDFPIWAALQPLKPSPAASSSGFLARISSPGCFPPAALGNTLLAARASPSALRFVWSDLPAATGYNLRQDLDPGGSFGLIAGSAASGTPGLTLPAPPEPLVFYRVSATSPCGEGPF